MKLYKLTDQNNKTRVGEINETVWGENVTHTASGSGTELCTDGVIHTYEDPRLAAILNPIHANFDQPKLWEAEGEIANLDGHLIVGVKSLTTIKEIPLPEITEEQKIKFAIYCALEVYKEETFVSWANKWLSGEDRTEENAARAVNSAEEAWRSFSVLSGATEAACWAAYWAAMVAKLSWRFTTRARGLQRPAGGLFGVGDLVDEMALIGGVGSATGNTAWATREARKDIDLIAILDKVMK